MSKKRKIDYIIEEKDNHRLIFRFYPRQSSCHSFGDEPPKSWDDVYKVYYSYAIISQWKLEPDSQWESDVKYYEHCDECSIIDEIAQRCLLLAEGYETYEREDGERIPLLDKKVFPFGMGTEWTISKRTYVSNWDDEKEDVYYKFTLFDYFDKGYRFRIDQENMKEFGEYLLGCCEYMLAHGDPI